MKTRDLSGKRKLRAAQGPVSSHTPIYKWHEKVEEGGLIFRYMVTAAVVVQNPTLVADKVSADARVAVTITDENGTETSVSMPLTEGVNDFQSIMLPPKHRLVVTLVSGTAEDVEIIATVARR
jgi:hypothetical protein